MGGASAGCLSRRGLLLAGVTPLLAGAATARAVPAAPRLAALDWGLAAVAVELGAAPVGVAELALYRAWVGEPALPEGTAELGLRTTPSLEGLALLAPDLILVNPLNESLRPRLDRIAPTFSNTAFTPDHAPLARAAAMTRVLGDRLGRPAAAETLVADGTRRIAEAAARLPPSVRGAAVIPLSLIDGRHLLVFGAGSLYADVLVAAGLRTGYPGATGAWGSALRAVSDLSAEPPAHLLVMDPVPPEAAPLLAEGGLLRRLAAARGHVLRRLPPAWAYGGLSAAARFADHLVVALAAEGGQGGLDRAGGPA